MQLPIESPPSCNWVGKCQRGSESNDDIAEEAHGVRRVDVSTVAQGYLRHDYRAILGIPTLPSSSTLQRNVSPQC
ncbi:hypothetical protein K7432_009663 [Basidiobolus ranarum]|uniref:Uncharacterized protein n=1 Tax=Basidiobolus ranarum TaxID=34480 RepID=A0ABR2WPW6_9FUNG